jgi:hypothetical protein
MGLHICRPMNDDVDLLLCFHAKVYLQVTTCTDRSQRHPSMEGTLNVTLYTMVVQGIGMGLCEFFTWYTVTIFCTPEYEQRGN